MGRSRGRGQALAIAAGALILALATPHSGAAQEPQGCWYFIKDAAARSLDLPWGVQLTADDLTGWPGLAHETAVHVAVTLEGRSATANRPFGYWQALGPDTLRIGYPGLTGVALHLGRHGRRLEGTAIGGPAGGQVGEGTPVRLTRGPCPGGS